MVHKSQVVRLVSLYIICCSVASLTCLSQSSRPATKHRYGKEAQQILSEGLRSGRAYELLSDLVAIGPRLSGSSQADEAVTWAKSTMERLGFRNVRLEPVVVPRWVRGDVEEARIIHGTGLSSIPLRVCALGGSIGTPLEGITAEVIQVKSFEELRSMGDRAKGKIVLLNRPMDRSKFSTFEAYGGAVGQRSQGAVEAARAGGVAALVRSMTTAVDDVPHTGSMSYNDTIPKIPAAAISTKDANLLDSLLTADGQVVVQLRLDCKTLPDVESANVIGELVGSEKPEEVVVVGAHLDSWDKGQGAHDDGAGCVQTIEALRLLKDLGLMPRRTIRAVLFMNEENGLRGAKAYAAKERPGERHIVAMESDAGGFSPRGFGVNADSVMFAKIASLSYLFESIDADRFVPGGGGADISELGKQGVPLIGLRVDGQRYFDYHHSDHDTIDKVNERELQLGAIAFAILSYVLAQEGL